MKRFNRWNCPAGLAALALALTACASAPKSVSSPADSREPAPAPAAPPAETVASRSTDLGAAPAENPYAADQAVPPADIPPVQPGGASIAAAAPVPPPPDAASIEAFKKAAHLVGMDESKVSLLVNEKPYTLELDRAYNITHAGRRDELTVDSIDLDAAKTTLRYEGEPVELSMDFSDLNKRLAQVEQENPDLDAEKADPSLADDLFAKGSGAKSGAADDKKQKKETMIFGTAAKQGGPKNGKPVGGPAKPALPGAKTPGAPGGVASTSTTDQNNNSRRGKLRNAAKSKYGQSGQGGNLSGQQSGRNGSLSGQRSGGYPSSGQSLGGYPSQGGALSGRNGGTFR